MKWGWGVAHAQALGHQLATFMVDQDNIEGRTFTVRCEYDAKRHCLRLYPEALLIDPPVAQWEAMLSDVIHNLSSALDNLAWALYLTGSEYPLKNAFEKKVTFPVCTRERDWRNAQKVTNKTRGCLPGIHPFDRAFIRRAQPYHAGRWYAKWQPLAVLRRLSNADKHQTPRPILAVPDAKESKLVFDGIVDCRITRKSAPVPRTSIQGGQEFYRMYVKKTGPHPNADVYPHMSLRPALENKLWLDSFINEARRDVAYLLMEFASPPTDLSYCGIPWDGPGGLFDLMR